MKNLISGLLLLISSIGFSQNVPNGGFENWETEDFFVLDDWVSYGFPERTTEHTSGNYAVKLVNYENADGNFYVSSLYNVDWQEGSVDKFPYDGSPLSMVFDTKYNLAAGDTAYFIAGFYEKGNWIGDSKIELTGNSGDTFETYSIPIVWYSLSRTPDSVFIGMRSNKADLANGEGYIIIDDYRYENIGYRTVEIKNYDFENWSNKGVVYPSGYMSLDLLAYRYYGGFLLNPSVSRDTNAFRGQYSLRVSNFDDWNNRVGEGACFTGDTLTDAWSPAFSVNDRYAYLQGYYKYNKGGNDEAEIALNMFVLSTALADGSFKINASVDKWTFFHIPINYYAGFTPDSATIRIVSAQDNAQNNAETVLFLDELEFVNTIDNRANVHNPTEANFDAYPIPATNHIWVTSEGGTFSILSVLGKEITHGNLLAGNTQIDISNLTNGSYILITTNKNNSIWHKKIIKQ